MCIMRSSSKMDFSFLMSSLDFVNFSPPISMMPSPTMTSSSWDMNIYPIIVDAKGFDFVP